MVITGEQPNGSEDPHGWGEATVLDQRHPLVIAETGAAKVGEGGTGAGPAGGGQGQAGTCAQGGGAESGGEGGGETGEGFIRSAPRSGLN